MSQPHTEQHDVPACSACLERPAVGAQPNPDFCDRCSELATLGAEMPLEAFGRIFHRAVEDSSSASTASPSTARRCAMPESEEQQRPGCEECNFQGWEVFNERWEEGYLGEVQACDACDTFETDEQAWTAALAAGLELGEEGEVLRDPRVEIVARHPRWVARSVSTHREVARAQMRNPRAALILQERCARGNHRIINLDEEGKILAPIVHHERCGDRERTGCRCPTGWPRLAVDVALTHHQGGNCWLGVVDTDVCTAHDEPRGECSVCSRCPACDASHRAAQAAREERA